MYDWATPVRILIVWVLTIIALVVAAVRTTSPPKARINFSAALAAHPPAQNPRKPRHYRPADPEDSDCSPRGRERTIWPSMGQFKLTSRNTGIQMDCFAAFIATGGSWRRLRALQFTPTCKVIAFSYIAGMVSGVTLLHHWKGSSNLHPRMFYSATIIRRLTLTA
jgi:hypothetical protein